MPKESWNSCWEGETGKYSQQVLAKYIITTKWKNSFPRSWQWLWGAAVIFCCPVLVWVTWLWWTSEDFDVSMLLCQMIKSDSFSSRCSGHSLYLFVGVHIYQIARQLGSAVLHHSYLVLSNSTEVLFFEDSKWGEFMFPSNSPCHQAVLCCQSHSSTGANARCFRHPVWFCALASRSSSKQ